MIRRWFIAGLLFWVPVGVTFLALRFLIGVLDSSLRLLPAGWHPSVWLGVDIPGLGAVLSLLIVLATGALVANFIGRRLLALGERVLHRIPLVRSLYSGVKQAAETIFSESGNAFRQVLLIEYPRKGIWTVAFQTGHPIGEVQRKTDREVITVFVPTTPNPTSGFIVLVPRDDAIPLDMSVEEGLRLIISLGVVTPESHPVRKAPASPAKAS